jgi:alpha-galactosidase
MDAASQFAADASPGAWNDPDMLEVGNGGMSDTEDRTHFSMWAMLSAPLIAGNDLTSMSAATLATLTNSEVIAVDQDPLGKQAMLISDNGSGLQVWSKQVTGGTVVALLNRSAASAIISVDWSQIGVDPSESVAIRDLWAAQDLGSATGSFSATVPSHGVTMLKLNSLSVPPSRPCMRPTVLPISLTGQLRLSPARGQMALRASTDIWSKASAAQPKTPSRSMTLQCRPAARTTY